MARLNTSWMITGFVLLVPAAACNSPLIRRQSPEVEATAEPVRSPERPAPQLIGDVTRTFGLHPLKVEGVALVNNLAGTGSDPPPSPLRDILLSEIRTHNISGATQLVASNTNALVTVTAYLPPGARKGDHVDAIVKVPTGSKTTSLRGGYLLPVRLQEMRLIQNRIRTGSVSADATGPVVIDAVFEGEDDTVNLLRGRVMGGVRSRINRPIHLVLRDDYRSGRYSAQIGRSINARFHYYDGGTKKGVAKPLNDRLVELQIPANYRANVGRFVQVVRRLALAETPAARIERLHILERKLMDPMTSASAAAELEAIGDEARNALLAGMKSSDPEIRFYAAEAAAYLDMEEAAEVLAESAEEEPAFRWHALAALTAMRHVAASESLVSLLNSESSETRYGAFRALRRRNPRDPYVRPEAVWNAIEYHALPTAGSPMIHFARTERQEIVLFGLDTPLRPPAVLFAGKQILVKGTSDGQIRVTRYAVGDEGDQHVVCPPRLDAVLRAVGEMGAGYGDLLALVDQARRNNDLTARVVVHALAEPGRRYYRDSKESPASTAPASYRRRPQMFADPLEEDGRRRSRGQEAVPFVDPAYQAASDEEDDQPGFWGRFRLWPSGD